MVLSVLGDVWSFVVNTMVPEVSPEEAGVKRLDVARDFRDVGHLQFLLSGLRGISPERAKRVAMYNNPSRGNALTLEVSGGRTAGRVSIYDKFKERPGRAAPGTVRWEVQARCWAKRYGNIRTVDDITEETVQALAVNRWEWSRMGTTVRSTGALLDRVERMGITDIMKSRFVGDLVRTAAGYEPRGSSDRAREFRVLLKEVGIASSEDLLDLSRPFSARLDWASGEEVVDAA
jgi:hypothetical protein